MASLVQRAFGKANRIVTHKLTQFRSPLRAAIIGYGSIGPDHLDSYELCGLANVAAISDINTGALAGALRRRTYLRGYQDYRHLLEEIKPDVISVCTWPQSHAEITRAAAEAGVKGILCEKPMALQMAEIAEMMRVCEQHGVKLAVGHQFRFNPWFTRARELLAQGAFGELRSVQGHVRGVLADNGPHLFDAVRFILGDRRPIQTSCRCIRMNGGFRQGLPTEESAEGEILFEGGARLSFVTGEAAPSFFGITIEGSKGSVELTPDSLVGTGSLQSEQVTGRRDYNLIQFREFIRWVKGQTSSYLATAEHGAVAAEMALSAYESSRLGTPVSLPLVNKGHIIAGLYPDAPPLSPMPSVSASSAVKALPVERRLAMHGGTRAVGVSFNCSPTFGKPELVNLTKVILSRKLSCTEGDMVNRCQLEFAQMYGAKHAVASTSGTAAIHVAVGALGLNPGDEVITTPLSDMGTVIPILACNCLPIFADIDPATGNLTAATIAPKITPRTKAVIVVHLFGRPVDLDPILALLRPLGIAVVEDCAQAHSAEYHGRKVGSIGDIGCFSLQQSKQITCGDGGITVTNRDDLAERAALFSDKGWLRSKAGRAGRNH